MDAFLGEVRGIAARVGRQKNLLKNNPNILWLHGSMCGLIVSAYGRVHNCLSKCLDKSMPSMMTITDAVFSTALKPAADNLVSVMMAGERFVDSCKCEVGNDHRDLVWIQKALYGGLSSEPIDTHIHNFLLAMCTLGDSIRSILASAGQDAHHDDALQDPDPFWKNGEATYPAYILIDGAELEKARIDDIQQIKKYLEGIIGRNSSQSQQASANDGDRFKWDLANLLLEKLKDHEGPQQGSSPPSMPEMPGITRSDLPGIIFSDGPSSAECFRKLPEILEALYLNDYVAVHKVRWEPAGSDKIFAQKRLSLVEKYGFESEALIHLRLHHPNIVQCLCAFVDDSKCGYILMEHMDTNLSRYITGRGPNNRMSLAEQVYVMLQIAKGMQYLHTKEIIYRDLKPENVLITDSRIVAAQSDPLGANTSGSPPVQQPELCESIQVKIADFNFAKTIKNPIYPDSLESGTNKVGTAYYRAPEVMEDRERLKYSKEVDVYSFGAVCFMMFLIGTDAFENGKSTLERIQTRRRSSRSLNELKGKCPLYLQRCIESWLNPNPKVRPKFKDICRVLRHLYSVVVRSRSESLPPFLSQPVDENTWRWVQEKVIMQEIRKLERFKKDKEWSAHSSVIDIPYEMYLMNFIEGLLSGHGHLRSQPEIHTDPTEHNKSGVLGCFLSCFQFCTSKTPIPSAAQAI